MAAMTIKKEQEEPIQAPTKDSKIFFLKQEYDSDIKSDKKIILMPYFDRALSPQSNWRQMLLKVIPSAVRSHQQQQW
jgi:hypothetical protein